MGKRKSAQRARPKAKARLVNAFQCLTCYNKDSVRASINKHQRIGVLDCTNCHQLVFQCDVRPFDEAVDVYTQYVDQMEDQEGIPGMAMEGHNDYLEKKEEITRESVSMAQTCPIEGQFIIKEEGPPDTSEMHDDIRDDDFLEEEAQKMNILTPRQKHSRDASDEEESEFREFSEEGLPQAEEARAEVLPRVDPDLLELAPVGLEDHEVDQVTEDQSAQSAEDLLEAELFDVPF